MARYSENECAWCAEEMTPATGLIGADWKVYCSTACRAAGEQASEREIQQLMQDTSDRHLEASVVAERVELPTTAARVCVKVLR